MKNRLIKYLFALLLVSTMISCVKDSFDGEEVGDRGTTFLKTPDGEFVVHWLSPFDNVQKVNLFTLFKDAHNASELNSSNTVKMVLAPNLIDDYNDEHGTDLMPLPADFYTVAQDGGVSVSGSEFSLQFGGGRLYSTPAVNLDGAKWDDLAQKYAMAFVITDLGNIVASSSLSDTVIVQIGLKNQWDGIYSVEDGNVQRYTAPGTPTVGDALNGSLAGNPDVSLETVSDNTVEIIGLTWHGGTSGIAGINNLRATVDPATNLVTMSALGNATLKNIAGATNTYDPATQTFTLNFDWNPTGAKREITNLVLKYKAAR